jgi:glycerophosphoryl diester phosphodiesterase
VRLVGHKGADLIVPGNTVESFKAAVDAGVDTIEFDVIWLRDAELPVEQRAPLMVAHDWEAHASRPPLPLTEALDAFLEPPLDRVEIDLDIKLPGREEEFVEALRERGLIDRAMISTTEMHVLKRVLELEPNLRRGWTYPKAGRDYNRRPWAKPVLQAALVAMRHSLPGLAADKLPKFDVFAMWVYDPLASARLARICNLAGVELIVWTVDDEARMRKLVAMGVDGLVSNDPRLYRRLDLPS